jgi:hypothetical protein
VAGFQELTADSLELFEELRDDIASLSLAMESMVKKLKGELAKAVEEIRAKDAMIGQCGSVDHPRCPALPAQRLGVALELARSVRIEVDADLHGRSRLWWDMRENLLDNPVLARHGEV